MALSTTRSRLLTYSHNYALQHPMLSDILSTYCTPSSPEFVQFLVDCSSLPLVVTTKQQQGPGVLDKLFHLTRTMVYSLHRDRLKMLDRWDPEVWSRGYRHGDQ